MEIYEVESSSWNWWSTTSERYLYRTKESAEKKFNQMREEFLKTVDNSWIDNKYFFDKNFHLYYNNWYDTTYELMLNKTYLLD